jgi:hypothetical protein
VLGSFALAIPLNLFVEKRFRRSQTSERSSDIDFLSVNAVAVLGILAIAMSAKLDDGWPWRLPPAAPDPTVLATSTGWREDTGLFFGGPPGPVALMGDSHADQYSEVVRQSLREAGLRGTQYRTANACALMQDNYAVNALAERATNKCKISQREWRNRIETENPSLVILASFWMYGVSRAYPARYVDDQSTAMPDIRESRARFERKMTETVDWLTANRRKVVIIGSTVLVDQPPSACYDRPHFFSFPDCEKLVVVSDPEAQAYLTEFFRKLVAGRSDVLYVDVASSLCQGDRCVFAQNGASLYMDRHHLTAYGAMWIRSRVFKPLTDFLRGSTS